MDRGKPLGHASRETDKHPVTKWPTVRDMVCQGRTGHVFGGQPRRRCVRISTEKPSAAQPTNTLARSDLPTESRKERRIIGQVRTEHLDRNVAAGARADTIRLG
jgi:hypothetical protein